MISLEGLGDEVIIGGKRYTVDHEKRSIRRFNDKTKMWVNVTFASEDSESVLDGLIDMLTEEYIRQYLDIRKSPT